LGIINLLATEVDDISKANVGTQDGLLYIYEQNEKRREKAIFIIENMLKTL